jgi:hypothetical protein
VGWRSISKTGEQLNENEHGRPVQSGEEGLLACIAQEDFGKKVAIDLHNGVIAIDYEDLTIQNETIEIHGHPTMLWICDETSIVGEMAHMETIFHLLDENDQNSTVRTDKLTPLTWRPIWFNRHIGGMVVKVIGAQTTLPVENGGKNIKKLITIFPDGRLGID